MLTEDGAASLQQGLFLVTDIGRFRYLIFILTQSSHLFRHSIVLPQSLIYPLPNVWPFLPSLISTLWKQIESLPEKVTTSTGFALGSSSPTHSCPRSFFLRLDPFCFRPSLYPTQSGDASAFSPAGWWVLSPSDRKAPLAMRLFCLLP